MTNAARWRFALSVLPIVLFGCDLLEPAEEQYGISVRLSNSDALPVHILAPDEDFAPANRISPKSGLVVSMSTYHGHTPMFRAGRDQQVLATIRCRTTIAVRADDPDRAYPPTNPTVVWTGAALVCANWEGRLP